MFEGLYDEDLSGFNTVNGIRVHAILLMYLRLYNNRTCFNTVNGIRVHAIARKAELAAKEGRKFQYRKRYKGACNTNIKYFAERWAIDSFNTVNGIRVHAIRRRYGKNVRKGR